MAELQPPADFPFPFEPYAIQKDFMSHLYQTLEKGKIGIFESPTGTGKSLSLICGSLKWLLDHNQREKERVEAILSGKMTAISVDSSGPAPNNQDLSALPDWFLEYDKEKALKDEAYHLKKAAERKQKREERVKKMKELYGHTLHVKDHSKKEKDPLEIFQDPFKTTQDPEPTADDDIVVDEYHSDDEHCDKPLASESSDDESDKDEIMKIYYTSRTHSQLSQFIHEVQKTPYRDLVTVVPLGSRLTYCVNEKVRKLKSLTLINDRCLELKRSKKKAGVNEGGGCGQELKKKRHRSADSGGCPYNKATRLETLRDLALGEVQDIEQLVSVGRRLGACPYYATRHAVSGAQLVVLPYNSLLHAGTREALGINLKGSMVVIDEAHNLLDTISSIHSVCVTYNHLKKSQLQLEQYKDKYRSRLKAKNLLYINQILHILGQFLKLFQPDSHSKSADFCINSEDPGGELTEVLRLRDFLIKSNVDNINMFKILKYCRKSEIAKKLNGFAQRYLDGSSDVSVVKKFSSDLDATVKTEATPSSPLLIIEQFLEALTSHDQDCRVVLKTLPASLSQSSLKYLLLNPSIHFTSIAKDARSIVVAGGTMEPISEFKDQLFLTAGISEDRFEHFSCGHVVGKDRLLPIVLSKGPSGVQFDFTFQKRNDLSLIDELGRMIANLCLVVPGGVVCFFSSYDYERRVYNRWEESGQLQKINKKKQVFREPKMSSQVDQVLAQFGRCIEFNIKGSGAGLNGALMLCVVGGKLSEGINFSDDLGRCVVMVGLPYPNLKSPELVEKMEYLNKTQPRCVDGKLPGQQHYENLCMKAVNQSIGRAIRHSNDYAAIILVDHRYCSPSIRGKLPGWISSELLVASSFGHMYGSVRRFYTSKNKSL